MPTVLRRGPSRVCFFSDEGEEPPHVHVDRDERTAKFWLGPVRLARNRGFAEWELGGIQDMVEDHEFALLEAWHGRFDG